MYRGHEVKSRGRADWHEMDHLRIETFTLSRCIHLQALLHVLYAKDGLNPVGHASGSRHVTSWCIPGHSLSAWPTEGEYSVLLHTSYCEDAPGSYLACRSHHFRYVEQSRPGLSPATGRSESTY